MSPARSALDYPSALKLAVGLVVAFLLLMGCTRTDDLGRVYHFSALDDPRPKPKEIFGTKAYKFADPLTDEEKQLRALADGVFAANAAIEPPGPFGLGKKVRWVAAPLELRTEAYASYIVRGPFRSVTARYARLIDDTRDDIARLENFFPVARKVADLDATRTRGLAHVPDLTEPEFAAASRRVRENMMLIAEVHRILAERAGIYRFTLEHLVVAAPSSMAIEAERIRRDLERRLAAIKIIGRSAVAVAAVPVSK